MGGEVVSAVRRGKQNPRWTVDRTLKFVGRKIRMIRIVDVLLRQAHWIVAVAACLVGLTLALTQTGQRVENTLQAGRNGLHYRQASGETVIVEIDAKSLREVQTWPWPRGIHGRLVDKLTAAGARNVVFDVDFTSNAADPRQDRLFAEALARHPGKVVLPGVFETVSNNSTEHVGTLPTAELRRHVRTGSIWTTIDDDMRVRQVPYSVPIEGARRPSLATILADRPSTRTGFIPIDWSIDPATIPTLSYSDVLKGDFDPEVIRGRNVLIGATAATMGDQFLVPNHYRIPGLYVQAVGSETLRNGDPVRMGDWPALAIAAIVIIGALVTTGSTVSIAIMAWTTVMLFIVPILIRSATPMVFGTAPAMMAIITALLLHAASQIGKAFLRRMTLVSGSGLPNQTAMRLARLPEGITVVVRMRNHVETTALLGAAAQNQLIQKVCARLALSSGGSLIYQVDAHSFAWRTDRTIEDLAPSIEGLHAIFAGGVSLGELTIDTSISVGICEIQGLDVEEAIAKGMVAANRAEQRGIYWERYESDDDDANWKLSLLGELDRAIDAGDVWVAYQSKYNLETRTVTGAEALVRWTHPTRGFIAPDRFIPVVEENGRIEKLTMFVLERAIRDFSTMDPALTIAVNLSMRLIGRSQIEGPLLRMLSKYGFDPSRLTLEITESATMADEKGIAELDRLRDMGVKISIDDYGTGQSTLSYLQKLPATELKIDRSFVSLILTSRSDATVVDSTIKLAHALGMSVVAEGVETKDVLDSLRTMGCDIIQGYYIAKPMALDQFKAQIATTVAQAA